MPQPTKLSPLEELLSDTKRARLGSAREWSEADGSVGVNRTCVRPLAARGVRGAGNGNNYCVQLQVVDVADECEVPAEYAGLLRARSQRELV